MLYFYAAPSVFAYADAREYSIETAAEPDTSAAILSLEKPAFSVTPGFYTESIVLELQTIHEGLEIRYTRDGSIPDEGSLLYSGPITLQSRAGDPNIISLIPTNNPGQVRADEAWQPPAGEVFKIHTIRARVFGEGIEPSEVLSGSFIIDEEGSDRYTMPVVSIITPPEGLFSDETGIYVPGTGALNYNQRGIEWERVSFFELFENSGSRAIAQNAGIRIHGGTSRSRPRKSLRVYARSDYGASWFNYQLFPDKPIGQFKRFILRNGGNDWGDAILRDGFMQSLLRGLDLDIQYFKPAIVFLNGEYWGIHNIRDRFDSRYIQTHYGLDESEFTMMSNNSVFEDGNPDGVADYNQMRSFLNNPGVQNPANYAHIQTRMDTDNFADYQIAQIYFRNTDWPGNNLQYWRALNDYDPDAPAGLDGRWRWMVFDTDFGFGLNFDYVTGAQQGPAHNTLAFALEPNGPGWPNPSWSTFILRRLMQNQEFRAGFINRFADLLNTTFSESFVTAELDSLESIYLPEIHEHSERWRQPVSTSAWQEEIQIMRSFAEERPGFVRQHLQNQFGLGNTVTITLDVNDDSYGFIRINRTDIVGSTPGVSQEPYPWEGLYFQGNEVRVEAIPRSGYQFVEWQGSISSTSEIITLDPQTGLSLMAVFESADPDLPVNPQAWNLSAEPYTFLEWSPAEPAGTYPPSMKFFQTSVSDPDLETERSEPWVLPYNLSNRSRINGLNNNGVGFINTANPQDDGGGFVGAAVLALNTTGAEQVYVGWRGRTIRPNSREYAIRLQYRVGSSGVFEDVLNPAGLPIEYVRSEMEGHSSYLGPFTLPQAAVNREYVELRWNYYYTGLRTDNDSGQRSKLALDDIFISTTLGSGGENIQFADLPASVQSGVSLPPFSVMVVDDAGEVNVQFNGEISLSAAHKPNGASLGGTLSVTASGGVASFTNITTDKPGRYVLLASAATEGLSVLSGDIHSISVNEIILPPVIQGEQPDNMNRVPYVYRLKIEGLRPFSTYRFANRVSDSDDDLQQDGAGNMIFAPSDGGEFIRSTSSPSFSPDELATGHYEFDTNESGSYEGWFITEPTGNRRFEPGKRLRMRILLNNGEGGNTVSHVLDTPSEVRVASFGTDPGKITGLAAISQVVSGNVVVLYNNTEGNGGVIAVALAEDLGIELDDRYAPFYREFVEGIPGRWATMLPNDLPTGILRIEERSLLDGVIVRYETSENGIWGEQVSTVNPSGGLMNPIIIDFVTETSDSGWDDMPGEFILHQNYPNPFNPATQISYSVPEAAHVKLDVYSVNGQLVTTLVNGMQSQGTHTVIFDSANLGLASGVYLYRLESGNNVQVKKMLLVK